MAFATTTDVEERLGRELTATEEASAEAALALVSELIEDAGGKAEADYDPVPAYFKVLCVEKALSAASNPNDLISETIGSYSYRRRDRNDDPLGLLLSAGQERKVREIANNAVSASTRTEALPHDIYVTEPVE